MAVQARLVNVEEFLRLLPAKEGHYELHHGEVVLMPPPKWGHQDTQDRIQMLLKELAGSRGVVRMEMAFRPAAEYEVWVADVGFVRAERAASTGDDEYLTGAPDLVVEVLSPGNTVDEMHDKMSISMANGCLSFWVVDPRRKMVSVTEGDVTRHYGVSASISLDAMDGSLPVREIFE
jgi:Uma2 family endonuclease